MKKVLYVMALVAAVVLTSCGGNKPEEKKKAIQIAVEVANGVEAKITFTPDSLDKTYYAGVFEKAEFNGATDNAVIADSVIAWIKADLDYYAQYSQLFGEVSFADYLVKGVQTINDNMNEETEYYVVAFYANEAAVAVIGDVYVETFTTGKVPQSENKISLAYDETQKVLNITTTNADPYYVLVLDEEYYNEYVAEGYSDKDILAEDLEYQVMWANMYGYDVTAEDFLFSGSQAYDFFEDYGGELESGEYYGMAGGYRSGSINTDVAKIKFTFEAPEVEEGDEEAAPRRIAKKDMLKGINTRRHHIAR